MKKIIIMGVLVALGMPALAQQTLYEGFKPWTTSDVSTPADSTQTNIAEKITSAAVPTEKKEWVKEVQKKTGALGRTFKITNINTNVLARIDALQAVMQNHRVLGYYKFIVPDANQLADLNQNQFIFLVNFLQQPIEKSASDRKEYTPEISHPQKGETQLTFDVDNTKLILLISNPKRVYFFTGHVPQQSVTPAPKNKADENAPRRNYTTSRIVNGYLGLSF